MSLIYATTQRFYGNYGAYKAFILNIKKVPLPDVALWNLFASQTRQEYLNLIYFSAAIIKSAIYPIALLLQILCLIYLIRGNSGYSRSARNWFILSVSADIASFLYLIYEMVTQDWQLTSPLDSDNSPSNIFIVLMWGLRDVNHAAIQNIVCKTFFSIVYFPVYLSPIALTMSSLLRCYSVKFPLRAKVVLTKITDRVLMICAVILALAVSIVLAVITIYGEQKSTDVDFLLGMNITYAKCSVPVPQFINSNRESLQGGYYFLMTLGLAISAVNMMSAAITVWVLFDARRARRSLQSTSAVAGNSNAEIRATMKLLGINMVIFVCFFLSRLFITMQYKFTANPLFGVSYLEIIKQTIYERLGSYLFIIPYCTNWLFIVGLDKKFYAYFFERMCRKKSDAASSMQLKTASEIMTR